MKCKFCGARKKYDYEDHNGVEVFDCLTPVDYSYQSDHCRLREQVRNLLAVSEYDYLVCQSKCCKECKAKRKLHKMVGL